MWVGVAILLLVSLHAMLGQAGSGGGGEGGMDPCKGDALRYRIAIELDDGWRWEDVAEHVDRDCGIDIGEEPGR